MGSRNWAVSPVINYLSPYSALTSFGCFQIDKETYLLLIDHHSKFIEIAAETGISGISAEISCITSQKRRQDVATVGSPR